MTAKHAVVAAKDAPRTGQNPDDTGDSITLLVVGICVAAVVATAIAVLAA